MKRIHRLIFPAFVLILVLACQAFNTHTLSGTKWELVSYGPLNSPVLPFSNSRPTLSFSASQAAFSTGCNTITSDYSERGGKISFSNGMMTLMACIPDELVKQESEISYALNAADSFTVSGSILTILYDSGNQAMTFERIQ
jgi:heat shock protein HslJ